eukprot:7238857-Pyramimonas_sp.AAC.1
MCTNPEQLWLPVEFPQLQAIADATRARFIAGCGEFSRAKTCFDAILRMMIGGQPGRFMVVSLSLFWSAC